MKYLIFAFLLFLPTSIWGKDITVEVNGMVCVNCVMAITDAFNKQEGVENVDISLENKTVKIDMNENANLTNEKIRELINSAGYETVNIKR